jgi:hypothetical protein
MLRSTPGASRSPHPLSSRMPRATASRVHRNTWCSRSRQARAGCAAVTGFGASTIATCGAVAAARSASMLRRTPSRYARFRTWTAAWSSLARAQRRDVFEDATEIPEADRRVNALRDFRGLEAGGLTSARSRFVDVEGGERGCESAPTGVLEGSGVVDPAVAVVIEGYCGGDVSPPRRAIKMW